MILTTNIFLIPHSLQGLKENLFFHGTEAVIEFEIQQIYAVVLSRRNNAELWIYLSIEYLIVVSAFNQRHRIIGKINNLQVLNTLCITSTQFHALILGLIPDMLYVSAMEKKEGND